jgi:hypothetical protein
MLFILQLDAVPAETPLTVTLPFTWDWEFPKFVPVIVITEPTEPEFELS